MATIQDLDAQIAAKAATLQAAPTRFLSDYLPEERERVPQGAAKFGLTLRGAGIRPDSNVSYARIRIRLVVAHYLADPYDELAYTLAAMANDLLAVADPNWWRSLGAVYEISDSDLSDGNTRRVGNILEWTVELFVLLAP